MRRCGLSPPRSSSVSYTHLLAKYRSRIVILEKESDAAMGQSKANSGIVHAGYDPQPGSLKAILNVKGSEMMEGICRDLAVKYRRNGTFCLLYTSRCV